MIRVNIYINIGCLRRWFGRRGSSLKTWTNYGARGLDE